MMRPEGGAGSRARLLDRARRLAGALLVVALCSAAGAIEPASLLKSVNLVAYRPRTMPPPFGSATLDGRPLALTDLRGWVVILNSGPAGVPLLGALLAEPVSRAGAR